MRRSESKVTIYVALFGTLMGSRCVGSDQDWWRNQVKDKKFYSLKKWLIFLMVVGFFLDVETGPLQKLTSMAYADSSAKAPGPASGAGGSGMKVFENPPASSGSPSHPSLEAPQPFHSQEYIEGCYNVVVEAYNTCVVERQKQEFSAGLTCAQADGSAVRNAGQSTANNNACGAQEQVKTYGICSKLMEKCSSSCGHMKTRFSGLAAKENESKNVENAKQAMQNSRASQNAAQQCERVLGAHIKTLEAAVAQSVGGAVQGQRVVDAAQATGGNNKGGTVPGTGTPNTPKDPEESKTPSWLLPTMVGGAALVVGNMIGQKQGKKKGFEDGKIVGREEAQKEAEESGADTDTDGDGVADTDCSTAESATNTKCSDVYLAKCGKDMTADGCTAFSDAYCSQTDPVPDAVFCRKAMAANYCTQSDSINKNNCPSCRELANGFTGQYSPEDLANSCAVCSSDPLCASNGYFLAYRNKATTSATSSSATNLPSVVLPSAVSGGSTSFATTDVSHSQKSSATTQWTRNQGTVTNGSSAGSVGGPFGKSSTSPLANGSSLNQHVGANQYGIASSLGQSNFRTHSQLIQQFCQNGKMVGCGALRGLSSSEKNSQGGESSSGSNGAQ